MNRWIDRWLTLLLLALIGWAGWSCLHWLWRGADWTVVMTNLPLYAVSDTTITQTGRAIEGFLLLLLSFLLLNLILSGGMALMNRVVLGRLQRSR